MIGSGYFAQCIMAAATERRLDESYRVYETDCLYAIGTAVGCKFTKRYYDILHPQPEDSRTGDEIAEERLERYGIKVVG